MVHELCSSVLFILACFCLVLHSTDALPGYIEAGFINNKIVPTSSSVPTILKRAIPKTNGTLIQVSVIFRHGDRVPDADFVYPNSPYKTASFYPYNFGELTLTGQNRLYNKGRELRKRYQSFLGDRYFTNLVESISSSYTRCQMSMQSLHTGLFGKSKDVPVKKLDWQAVPYSIIPASQDNLISVHLTCPKMMDNVIYPESTDDPDTKLVFQALQNYSGFPGSIDYRHAFIVYDYLKTSAENGLPIPEEFAPIFPEPLRKTAMLDWHYTSLYTTNLISLLISRITNSAIARASNTLQPENRKMYLYAGHDLDIYLILQALSIDINLEELQYGAYIFFELHNIQDTYGFKVYLQNDCVEPKLLDIPDCGMFCPLAWFTDLGEKLKQRSIICN